MMPSERAVDTHVTRGQWTRSGRVAVFAWLLMASPLVADNVDELAFFEDNIRPLLVTHCINCHGPRKSESGLRLDTLDGALKGGASGPALIVGQPDESLLIEAVRQDGGLSMPPDEKLTDREIAQLTRWIQQGAAWPEGIGLAASGGPQLRGGPITDVERAFWSFQPVADPSPPEVEHAQVNNDIDRFIIARLREANLDPMPCADRRALIRRATFDLIGLPPTPEEVQAFLDDQRPEAFNHVVDRLLASKAYGERWGRHWLDVVRYADTAGETGDYPTPLSYKYRNWVIRAFHCDMPYDEFVRQQIAGDILARQLIASGGAGQDGAANSLASQPMLEDYQGMLTATGFIAISRRFGFDVENYHHLTIQDTIDTLGQSILGLSLGCARCHDHKYDPVSTADYYAWYGIFDSTRYSFPGSEEKKRPYDLLSTGESGSCEQIYGAVDKDEASDARIQIRGEPHKLGDKVPRKNLEILGNDPLPAGVASGRLQLAHWLTDESNPLMPRVMANRIWQLHFGSGLVRSANDFGARGERPTHPELLDWLASRFKESGYSVKAMHRLIMTSAAYQRSGTFDHRAFAIDPDTRLLWRFPRRRLSAEEIRDAMLFVSGDLDVSEGNEHPFPPVESWAFTQHAPYYGVYPTNRRSIYLMQQRLKRHPFLALFDGADPNVSTARRDATTVPTQSLYLMNNEFVHDRAASLAGRVMATRADETARMHLMYQVSLGRPPDLDEVADAGQFLDQYAQSLAVLDEAPRDVERTAWSALARIMLTRNEFLFVD